MDDDKLVEIMTAGFYMLVVIVTIGGILFNYLEK